MIPANQKEIVQSLVELHTYESSGGMFNDIIPGKVQNVVVLLKYGTRSNTEFHNELTIIK